MPSEKVAPFFDTHWPKTDYRWTSKLNSIILGRVNRRLENGKQLKIELAKQS